MCMTPNPDAIPAKIFINKYLRLSLFFTDLVFLCKMDSTFSMKWLILLRHGCYGKVMPSCSGLFS